eukprot:750370-Hanusia_phi.AAC.3
MAHGPFVYLGLRGGGPKKNKAKAKGATAAKKSDAKAANLKAALLDDTLPVVTGNLESHEGSRDIKIGRGQVLIQDTSIELNYGRRYGLLGANGVGKTSFLKALAARLVPIPEFHDIFILSEEAKSTNLSALEYVVKAAEVEVDRLEKKVEDIIEQHGPEAGGVGSRALPCLMPCCVEQTSSSTSMIASSTLVLGP